MLKINPVKCVLIACTRPANLCRAKIDEGNVWIKKMLRVARILTMFILNSQPVVHLLSQRCFFSLVLLHATIFFQNNYFFIAFFMVLMFCLISYVPHFFNSYIPSAALLFLL